MSKEQFTDLQVSEQCGEIILGFGKYYKKLIKDIPLSYLEWCLKENAGSSFEQTCIAKYLDHLKTTEL